MISNLGELFIPTAVLIVVGTVVLCRHVSFSLAVMVMCFKALLPVTYFLGLWGEPWTLQDDLLYYEVGLDLSATGYSPWQLIFDNDASRLLERHANSRHTLYYAWNSFAQMLFGPHYHSAVFANLIANCVTVSLVGYVLRLSGVTKQYCQCLVLFLCLHWDYASWISFVNLKESLVELLIWIVVSGAVSLMRKRSVAALAMIVIPCLTLMSIRGYVPVLLFGAFVAWQFSCGKHRYRTWMLLGSIIALIVAGGAVYRYGSHMVNVQGLATGTFRFFLTPKPWNVDEEYSFLLLASSLHWLAVVPAIYGARLMWKSSPEARLILLMAALFVAFYAVFPSHQGPRHRVQITACIAIAQFNGFWHLARQIRYGMVTRTTNSRHVSCDHSKPGAAPVAGL
ncbi:MAG: hypothetical protein KDA62_02060 [Planctomycetales bacterium]|nr:hypothetical protein [Planctomycetales bacterium]